LKLDADTFFRELFGDELDPGHTLELRELSRVDDGRRQRFFSSVDEFIEAAKNQVEGWCLYHGVNVRNGNQGTADAVKLVTSIWADVDDKNFTDGRRGAVAAIKDFPIPPTVVVDSGHGLQPYWLLKEPEALENPGEFRRTLRGVQRRIGSDIVDDLPRILRCPGTINYKAEPVDCKVIFADFSRRFCISDFVDFAEPDEGPRKSAEPVDGDITENRNKALFSLAGSMRRRGMSSAAILAALLTENARRCKPPMDESEVREIARKGAKYEPGDPVAANRPSASTGDWRLYDLAELPTVEVPPLRWIVDGLIPEGGIGWLSGPPKESKSLLALDLVIHLAHAQPWIGRYRVEPMNSLYIAREDPLRRLKERAAEINSGYGYPDIPAGRALFLVREKFTLTSEKSLEWLETEAKRTGARLLILDVLNRMVPDLDELSAKDMAVMVSVLEIINRDLGLTVLCLDHTRKPQGPKSGRNRQDANPFDLKGSIAKYGAADFMLCLARTEQDGRLQLYAENKDADERPHILLDVSPKDSGEPKFTFAGDVESLAENSKKTAADNREKIKNLMADGVNRRAGDVGRAVGMHRNTARTHLNALVDAGELDSFDGWYGTPSCAPKERAN
jgi:hypothetical protein